MLNGLAEVFHLGNIVGQSAQALLFGVIAAVTEDFKQGGRVWNYGSGVGANDPPVNTVPGTQTIAENTSPTATSLAFSAADGNALSVDDPDAFINTDELQVTLTATNGTLTLPSNFATLG